MVTSTPSALTVSPDHLVIADKLDGLEAVTNGIVLESTDAVRCGITAMLAGRHMCMIGPPGVAKSFMVRTLVGHIGGLPKGAYFETMLGKMDTPGKLLGPVSLKALEQDIERRNTTGRLPEALIAFLDEIWEGSSALLEYLLPILNERLFHNNGVPTLIPLVSAFMASNKTPERSSELAAVWDRVTFRMFVKPIQDDGNFETMLRQAAARFQRLGFNGQDALPASITWDEMVAAQHALRQVEIPDDVFSALTKLRRSLSAQGIEPSERRFNEALPIIQATAYRDRRMVAEVEDMRLLAHVLWNTQDQQPVVQRMVLELASPLDKKAMELEGDVEGLARDLTELLREADNAQDRGRRGVEIAGKLEAAAQDLGKLRKQIKAERRKSDLVEPLRQRILGLTRTLHKEVFQIGGENADLAPDSDDEE